MYSSGFQIFCIEIADKSIKNDDKSTENKNFVRTRGQIEKCPRKTKTSESLSLGASGSETAS